MTYHDIFTQDQIKEFSDPFPIITSISGSKSAGTLTSEDFETTLDYIWENYSDFFSVYKKYRFIKNLEKQYSFSSEVMFPKWLRGELVHRGSFINDWISSYLKVKNFIT